MYIKAVYSLPFFLELCYYVYLHLYLRVQLQVSVPDQNNCFRPFFLYYFCISLQKKSAKMMMEGAHCKAKINTRATFRGNFSLAREHLWKMSTYLTFQLFTVDLKIQK